MDTTPREALERAGRLMSISWERDVLPLRASRMLHERVKPLFGKLGTDGHVIGRLWFQDHVLSSIRRMVDTGEDVVSIRQALIEVRRVADEVTAEVLLEFHGREHEDEALDLRLNAELIRLTVEGARPNEPDADISVIGKRTVQADLGRIREVANRAHRLATLVSAHRLETDEQIVVTDEEIEHLLASVSDIYSRWSLPLRAVDVDTRIDHFQVGYRTSEALHLYDHDRVGEAMREHLHSLGPRESMEPRSELVKQMRADYRFDDPGGERAHGPG